MARFLHTADLHLGAPWRSLGRRVPSGDLARLRRAASGLWPSLVTMAVEQRVDGVLIAGDVYDGAERSVAEQLAFADGLDRLHDEGIATLIVHGNHDPVRGDHRPVRPTPPSAVVFGADEVGWAECSDVTVAGISYARRAETRNLARLIRESAARGAPCTVGLVHANVGGREGHAPYAPAPLADLVGSSVSYWALGHVHARETIELGDGRVAVYPGTPMGRSSAPGDVGPKGVVLVEVGEGAAPQVEFVGCGGVEFRRISLDIGRDASLEHVGDCVARVTKALDALGTLVVIDVELIGALSRHERYSTADAAATIRARCAGSGVIVSRVRMRSSSTDDATLPSVLHAACERLVRLLDEPDEAARELRSLLASGPVAGSVWEAMLASTDEDMSLLVDRAIGSLVEAGQP